MGQSIYFHRANVADDEENSVVPQVIDQSRQLSNPRKSCDKNSKIKSSTLLRKIRNAYALLWKHFVLAYTNYRVVKWSAWWALSTCGYLLVATYSQLLWQTAVKPGDRIYNGAVDFAYAIVGKGKALLMRQTCCLNFIKTKYKIGMKDKNMKCNISSQIAAA